jgi:hypothetical protein
MTIGGKPKEAEFMATIALPELDRSTIDAIRKRFAEMDRPSRPRMERVGKQADKQLDKLLGQPQRGPGWPWIAAGVSLVAVVGLIAAYFMWLRRPSWESSVDPWTGPTSLDTENLAGADDAVDIPSMGQGRTAAESSLASPYSSEEA